MGHICLALGLHAWGKCIPFVLYIVKYCLLFWKENIKVQVFESSVQEKKVVMWNLWFMQLTYYYC
jgi:hypothetical protein